MTHHCGSGGSWGTARAASAPPRPDRECNLRYTGGRIGPSLNRSHPPSRPLFSLSPPPPPCAAHQRTCPRRRTCPAGAGRPRLACAAVRRSLRFLLTCRRARRSLTEFRPSRPPPPPPGAAPRGRPRRGQRRLPQGVPAEILWRRPRGVLSPGALLLLPDQPRREGAGRPELRVRGPARGAEERPGRQGRARLLRVRPSRPTRGSAGQGHPPAPPPPGGSPRPGGAPPGEVSESRNRLSDASISCASAGSGAGGAASPSAPPRCARPPPGET